MLRLLFGYNSLQGKTSLNKDFVSFKYQVLIGSECRLPALPSNASQLYFRDSNISLLLRNKCMHVLTHSHTKSLNSFVYNNMVFVLYANIEQNL